MGKEIKFRYRILDDHTGQIIKVVYSLKDIENKDFHGLGTMLSKDQYTGLTDKKGIEIYEGDIIQDSRHENNVREIKWGEVGMELEFGTGFNVDRIMARYYKVIGNIYENKELIK